VEYGDIPYTLYSIYYQVYEHDCLLANCAENH